MSLKHLPQIQDFYAWRSKKLELARQTELEEDEIEVTDYTTDTYSELKDLNG